MCSNRKILGCCSAVLVGLGAIPGQCQTDQFEWSVAATFQLSSKPTLLALSPDGSRLAVGMADGDVQLYDGGRKARLVRHVVHHAGPVRFLAFSNDGFVLVSGGQDGMIHSDSNDESASHDFRIKGKLVTAALSRDRQLLAVAGDDRTVTLWDLTSQREIGFLLHRSKKRFLALHFSNKDDALMGISESGSLCEWDVKLRTLLRCVQEQDQTISAASFASGATFLALGTGLLDLQKGGFNHMPSASAGVPDRSRSNSPIGSQPVAGTARPGSLYRETHIRLFDLERGVVAKTLDGVHGEIASLTLSSDGRFVALARELENSSILAVYDTRRGVEVASARLPSKGTTVMFSQLGGWLGVATDRGEAILRAVQGLNIPTTFDDLRGRVITISSSNTRPLLAPVKTVLVAVVNFDVNGTDSSEGRLVADLVRTRLSEGENVALVERARIDQVMEEQLIHRSDRFDPATAAKLGKLLGAAKMLIGSVNRVGPQYVVTVRLVDVERGAIDGEREVTCQPCGPQDLQEAVIALKQVLVK